MEIQLGTETPIIVSAALLGAFLLILGLGIGLWVGRRSSSQSSKGLDAHHLRSLLGGLFKWTNGFAADVTQYREVVEEFAKRFDSVAATEVSEDHAPVMLMLQQIAGVNDELRKRIDKAEEALQDQTEQIAGYMSEARSDTLTGLPNRRVFDDELGQRVAEWNRYGTLVAVMILDIDFFKRFNDEHGHLAGDAVLQQVSRVMEETMRETDIVVRLGGEEFAAVLPGIEGEGVWLAAERTRKAVENGTFRYEGTDLSVTVSCGSAMAIENDTPSELVKRADEALYSAKHAGRNCSHWHDGWSTIAIGSGHSRQAAADNLARDPDFGEICDELRQRLLTVVGDDE